LDKKVIMAVDDDADNNFSLKLRLEKLDPEYEVITVDSGKKCLELLENNEIPDIILMDIMMPETNGWETYQKLKENSAWKNIPVIFVSASSDELAERIKGLLGDDYIEKPYDIEDVKKRIDEILENVSHN
jgi:CheY-like chemotaxis protein